MRMNMFGSKRQDEFSSQDAPRPSGIAPSAGGATVIAHGVKVEGDFSSQGDVTIEGEVQGSVKVAGRLSVGPQAVLKADVSADQASIAGNVTGNVTVKGQLQLASTAKVLGDVTSETVSIDSGAVLNGKVAFGGKSEPNKMATETKASS